MNRRKSWAAWRIGILLTALGFFLSCTPGSPSEEEVTPGGAITISGNLSSGGGAPPIGSAINHSRAAAVPLAGYQLYCVTVTAPVVEGIGVADASGNVTVTLKVKSASFACSVLDPAGVIVASLFFSDVSGTNKGQAISGSGSINLGPITVNLETKEANATVPANVPIVNEILPETTITSKPFNPSDSQSAEFQFNCDQTNCTFECNLDAEGWASCASSKTYDDLSLASHTFQVRAKNAAGYIDPTPARYTWTIEEYSVEITITGTLVGSGPSPSLLNPELAAAAESAPLAGYKLYCVTVTAPVVEGTGVADASGNVTVVLEISRATFACSVLDPEGNRVACITFSDASGANHGQIISGIGDINLGNITVSLDPGVAEATVPSNVTIAAITTPETTITSNPPK